MPLQTVLSIGIQIADALAAAHKRDIIHRDIKPENVIIANGDKAKVLDFGLAKTIEDVGPNLTRSDCLIGTPAYMSPEQAKGGRVDRRSDIFSFE
jgi:serine/threonine-protein kinase